jgi:MFS family permease
MASMGRLSGEGDLIIYAALAGKATFPKAIPQPAASAPVRSPSSEPMSRDEKRAGISLAAIFGLRMLGLFIILPVFTTGAALLAGGHDLALVGMALGAYGLTQALFQIPFGAASDKWGRKPVIVAGLLLFAAGSVVAALATDIQTVILGRVLQGAGAISAAVTALAADLTREQHRTKVMAMIGSSIGLVFAMSLVGAPLLYAAVGLSGIFWLTGALALGAIALLLVAVPAAPAVPRATGSLREILLDGQLMRLNFGVFVLHLMQTAMWVTVPAALSASGHLPTAEHWKVYLPALLVSFVVLVPAVIFADRRDAMKPVFNGAIALLLLVQGGLYLFGDGLWPLALWLTLFFVAFNVLEATQPSWISRIAPPHAKGTALGVYNTLQSIGLFMGGALGGWIAQHYGADMVRLFCGALALAWLALSVGLAAPRRHGQAQG